MPKDDDFVAFVPQYVLTMLVDQTYMSNRISSYVLLRYITSSEAALRNFTLFYVLLHGRYGIHRHSTLFHINPTSALRHPSLCSDCLTPL